MYNICYNEHRVINTQNDSNLSSHTPHIQDDQLFAFSYTRVGYGVYQMELEGVRQQREPYTSQLMSVSKVKQLALQSALTIH
jgi:hypothetical protein